MLVSFLQPAEAAAVAGAGLTWPFPGKHSRPESHPLEGLVFSRPLQDSTLTDFCCNGLGVGMLLLPPPTLVEVRLILIWDPDLVLGDSRIYLAVSLH